MDEKCIVRKQETLWKSINRYMKYMRRIEAENSEFEQDIDGNVIYWKDDNLLPIPLPFAYFLENIN
jgi:hypothetical protein